MRKLTIAVCLGSLFGLTQAQAEGIDGERLLEAAKEMSGAVFTPEGQREQAGPRVLVEGVQQSAVRLQDAVDGFRAAMAQANSQDSGMAALDEMLDVARDVNESLNKDSEIWNELQRLIDEWTAKRDSVIERARTNPGLQKLAKNWQDKVDQVIELRSLILDQATDSEMLVQDIENKKEIIAEYYELNAIDLVLAEMQVMSDELTAMNDSMRLILEQTAGVEGDLTPTTN
ncbi:hypothetical protein [Marichromatium bheemlicum]|uniref:Uncharacterized protein n=1 Tax=Marichromatium bheemlicum TaxID=365339 RepID=A0ABX1I5N4_9GAMM|nr:hypothetical protein [Marichromatium bheemlicum]NKN31690.1 hypothetical protein [Marichromatium bheemlicum]